MNVRKNFIPANDNIDLLWADYYSEDFLPIRSKFNQRDKKINVEELSYRILNHWEKNDLILSDRGDDGTGWRKYSKIDLIWIQLIVELRKFGVSIENIRTVKEQLTQNDTKPSIYPMLEFYTAFVLSFRRPVYIMIFDNFEVLIASQKEIEQALIVGSIGNHIRISLHDIVKIVSKKGTKSLVNDFSLELSAEEMRLILELRTGAYKKLTIKLQNGKLRSMEKTVDVEKELYQMMKEKNYDTITIERENGKTLNITQIIKEKF